MNLTCWTFDDCELDLAAFELRRGGVAVHIEPQVFAVLTYLIRHRNRVVPKTELLEQVWGDRFVSDSALTSRLKAARRAVGDNGSTQRVIRTAHGRGYQFVATVAERLPPPDQYTHGNGTTPHGQHISFCIAPDGTRIAYATAGEGPPLVRTGNWITHLDYDWDNPVWRHWMRGLTRGRRLIRYDERGCGLSDWDLDEFSFQAWVDDLRLVADTLELERFPLLGISQGGAVAIAYAALYPERVSRLVLFGAYPRGRLVRAETDEERREAALNLELARVGWHRDDPAFRQVFTTQFLPDSTREQWAAFNELQRRSTSVENAVRFLDVFARIDVTELAPLVRCPTLIMHSRGDLRVPLSSARELATLIPGSRLVPLHSRNHILTEEEPAWPIFLAELDRFLAED